MPKLKISMPTGGSAIDLSQFLGAGVNSINGWEILINDGTASADAWVVIEDLAAAERCTVDPNRVIFASAEVIYPDGHYSQSSSRMSFLAQFSRVLTCHDINLDSARAHPPFLPWMLNANHGPSVFSPHPRDINYLRMLEHIEKSREISVFCSSKALTSEQAMRLEFVKTLSAKFKDRLHWYGNGVNPVETKWEGLAPYKYALTLENRAAPNIVTEKLPDAFLALCLPIYWGAPNASDFFDPDGFRQIDIRDWSGSVEVIEQVLDEDPYESALPAIVQNKSRVLNEFHFLKRLVDAVEGITPSDLRVPVTLGGQDSYVDLACRLRRSVAFRAQKLATALTC